MWERLRGTAGLRASICFLYKVAPIFGAGGLQSTGAAWAQNLFGERGVALHSTNPLQSSWGLWKGRKRLQRRGLREGAPPYDRGRGQSSMCPHKTPVPRSMSSVSQGGPELCMQGKESQEQSDPEPPGRFQCVGPNAKVPAERPSRLLRAIPLYMAGAGDKTGAREPFDNPNGEMALCLQPMTRPQSRPTSWPLPREQQPVPRPSRQIAPSLPTPNQHGA